MFRAWGHLAVWDHEGLSVRAQTTSQVVPCGFLKLLKLKLVKLGWASLTAGAGAVSWLKLSCNLRRELAKLSRNLRRELAKLSRIGLTPLQLPMLKKIKNAPSS